MSIIDKIGLEVEGGWNGVARVPPFDDLDLVADHSIDGNTLPTDRRMASVHVGEAVSTPMGVDGVDAWIDKYWPTETNRTCGYHIHVSVKEPLHYMLLTKKVFAFRLLREVERLGQELKLPDSHYLWERLSGMNPFCSLSFDAQGQMNVKAKRVGMRVRYGFLNFALNIHGTMEFRALPTFETPSLAKKFTHAFINLVEEYVPNEEVRDQSRSVTVIDEDGIVLINKGR